MRSAYFRIFSHIFAYFPLFAKKRIFSHIFAYFSAYFCFSGHFRCESSSIICLLKPQIAIIQKSFFPFPQVVRRSTRRDFMQMHKKMMIFWKTILQSEDFDDLDMKMTNRRYARATNQPTGGMQCGFPCAFLPVFVLFLLLSCFSPVFFVDLMPNSCKYRGFKWRKMPICTISCQFLGKTSMPLSYGPQKSESEQKLG